MLSILYHSPAYRQIKHALFTSPHWLSRASGELATTTPQHRQGKEGWIERKELETKNERRREGTDRQIDRYCCAVVNNAALSRQGGALHGLQLGLHPWDSGAASTQIRSPRYLTSWGWWVCFTCQNAGREGAPYLTRLLLVYTCSHERNMAGA